LEEKPNLCASNKGPKERKQKKETWKTHSLPNRKALTWGEKLVKSRDAPEQQEICDWIWNRIQATDDSIREVLTRGRRKRKRVRMIGSPKDIRKNAKNSWFVTGRRMRRDGKTQLHRLQSQRIRK